MFDYGNIFLQWSRTLGQRLFLRFGLHCATHQIRIILVSCVVITSLFYPALAIYASSQPRSLSLIDTFTKSRTILGFDAQKDLVNLWSRHNDLRIHEDAVSRAKCGASHALRVERLFIRGLVEDHGAMTHQTLLSTLDFERRLERYISNGDTPCLKRSDGKCFVLSPLLFWNHNREALLSDTDILDTLGPTKNISLGGIFVTPQMVLASRRSREPQVAGSKFDFAAFLAVTYFFPDSDCLDQSEHNLWIQSVYKALEQKPEPVGRFQEPILIALEYDPHPSKGESWSALSTSTYLAYIGFFVYVIWSVGRMTAVHSRLGVTFTALVEIAVSTITSLSVCALVGFKVTMVPWELLPIVIIFVGAENMFNLVDAVCKTSVTLSVKQRIAEGLSRAGTSNTLKVVSYNSILGVIAVFSVGAVRQFCTFAIVVLVAHWFLAHTFFLAVLSIDLQRLELDELLRHDSSMVPATRHISQGNMPRKPRSAWQKLMFTAQNLLRSRAATNISLLMLLAITATLYYITYTSSTFNNGPTSVSQFSTASLINTHEPPLDKNSTAWHIWKTLNPAKTTMLHLRIEAPSIVTFRPDTKTTDAMKLQKSPGPRFSMRTFRLILWLLKIMVLPIAVTTSALWGLLLYLLKDAELLEAQRNRGEPDISGSQEDSNTLLSQISFSTLPRTFSSDVELIAASNDGNVIISVGLHNEIILWRIDKQTHVSIDATDVILSAASTSSAISTLTSVAVDSTGYYCAVGTSAGIIAIWTFQESDVCPLPPLLLDNVSAAVTELQFISGVSQSTSLSCAGTPLFLLATYENGTAVKWSLEKDPIITYFTPSSRASTVKCSLVRVHPLDHFLVAFSMDDGTLELAETHDVNPLIHPEFCVQAGNALSTSSRVHACQTVLGGSSRCIVAVATEAGRVSLWDGSTNECISVFDEVYGRINQLWVTSVDCETCHFCGQLPLESISVALSVDYTVHLFRLYLNDQTRRCSCSRHQLRHALSRDNLGRRSRSNSMTTPVGSASPSILRARLATTFEASDFPVSGHGVHSRRASEKETGRRSSETLTVPLSSGECDSNSRPFSNSTTSFWHDVVLVRETDITCERGGWGVNGKKLIGIRRKPRSKGNAQNGSVTQIEPSSHGLTMATLERWELWTFDPSASHLQSSLLAALTVKTNSSYSSPDCAPRLPFTRASSLLIVSTHAFAGFGNTIGIFHLSH